MAFEPKGIGDSTSKLVATSAKSPTKGPDAEFVMRVAGAGCFVEWCGLGEAPGTG